MGSHVQHLPSASREQLPVHHPPDHTSGALSPSLKMMLGKSLPEYIFIKVAIAALRLIAPLSVLWVAWSLLVPAPAHLDPKWALLSTCSLTYASLEAAFFVCIYLPRRYHLQKVRHHRSSSCLRSPETRTCRFVTRIGGKPPQTVPRRTPGALPEML